MKHDFCSIKEVHIWVPELIAGKGGIQMFSSHLIEALHQMLGPARIRVFSKNDTAESKEITRVFATSGGWHPKLRTLAFAAQAIGYGLLCKPDLVITTHLNFGTAARWLKKMAGIPYWCAAHGIEAWNMEQTRRIRGLQSADRILAVSAYTQKRLLDELSFSPNQIVILPNTFDSAAFLPGPKSEKLLSRHGISRKDKVLLTVARLENSEQYKGYDRILQALPVIRRFVPEVRYVLVGKGPDQFRLESLAAELKISDLVTFAGCVPGNELADYYNLCDVFAMPSKGEGFGIVYLEAMACGKPVLAGNGDGSAGPLQRGEVGVLVDPDDQEAIASSLIEMLKGTYPLPILYSPDDLRARTIAAFGFDHFLLTLTNYLEDFVIRRRHSLPVAGPN